SPGAQGVDRGRVGPLREQPPGSLLPADRRGARGAPGGAFHLAELRRRRLQGAGDRLSHAPAAFLPLPPAHRLPGGGGRRGGARLPSRPRGGGADRRRLAARGGAGGGAAPVRGSRNNPPSLPRPRREQGETDEVDGTSGRARAGPPVRRPPAL